MDFRGFFEAVKVTEGISLITLHSVGNDAGVRNLIFDAICAAGVNLDMICQTPNLGGGITVSLTMPDDQAAKALGALAGIKDRLSPAGTTVSPQNASVAFHSGRMVETPGVAAYIFDEFSRAGIEAALITTSDVSVSILVPKADAPAALPLAERMRG